MGLMRDLTPNPLSMNGEGARARRNRLNYRSFPLSIHGEGAGGEVSRRCVPNPPGHRSRVAVVIERMFGVRYSSRHVGRLLKRLNWWFHKPQMRAVQRDEAAIESWLSNRWPALRDRAEKEGRTIVFLGDRRTNAAPSLARIRSSYRNAYYEQDTVPRALPGAPGTPPWRGVYARSATTMERAAGDGGGSASETRRSASETRRSASETVA